MRCVVVCMLLVHGPRCVCAEIVVHEVCVMMAFQQNHIIVCFDVLRFVFVFVSIFVLHGSLEVCCEPVSFRLQQ